MLPEGETQGEENDMGDFAIKKPFEEEKNWPRDEKGEPVPPALLAHLSEANIEADIMTNMLRAFNIPVFRVYPNDGDFGRIILGFSGSGVEIYVPETMLADAQNLISADIEPETEENL